MIEKIEIKELQNINEQDVIDINNLLEQLTGTVANATPNLLEAIISNPFSHLFVATIDGKTIGMCTICCYVSPTGGKAWIEDVTVDSCARGKGIGRMLVANAIDFVKALGGYTLYLTSRPMRVAANKLYCSMGFERKETNVYKMEL